MPPVLLYYLKSKKPYREQVPLNELKSKAHNQSVKSSPSHVKSKQKNSTHELTNKHSLLMCTKFLMSSAFGRSNEFLHVGS